MITAPPRSAATGRDHLVRLLRRNATVIQGAFASLWAIRFAATGHPWEVPAMVAVAAYVAARRAFRATPGLRARDAFRTAAGRGFLRPVTLATVAQLVASIVLPVVASSLGSDEWSVPLVALSISLFLVVFGRQLALPAVSAVGVAYTAAAVLIPVLADRTTIAAAVSIVSAVALLTSTWICAARSGATSPR